VKWTVTLEVDGTARLFGEMSESAEWDASGTFCRTLSQLDMRTGIGTWSGNTVAIEVAFETKKEPLALAFGATSMQGNYAVSFEGVLAGWGKMKRAESGTISLNRQ
jgi:hypothetical protein